MVDAGASIEAVLTLNSSGFETGITDSINAVKRFAQAIDKIGTSTTRIDALSLAIDTSISALNQMDNVSKQNLNTFNKLSTAINKMANGLKILQSDAVDVDQAVNTMNNIFKAFQGSLSSVEVKVKGVSTSVKELSNTTQSESMSLERATSIINQNSQAMQKNGAEILRNMGYTGELSAEKSMEASAIEKNTASVEKNTSANEKNTQSMNKQASASKGLGKSMSSLKMMTSMVGSMLVYNFAHNLITATRETVNAKSEMNGYFQMLGYGSGEVSHFNQKLDEMIQKFPRINKYSLGETISSIGVEFELTTKEMEKAMPVVSMITSEYLRAGRNVNEASLAVKDILQGEFQRLSRETGVKGEQLKEAGWSGDKNDVMGLLKALNKVGHDRNWDLFVAKANSLNDAVIILQNRFGEWSADMVEKVQPIIVQTFNELMTVASQLASIMGGAFNWLNSDGIVQNAIKWGGLATAIIGGTKALMMYRTGANLTQLAQMGWRNSIVATILGLEAETVAETDSYTAIVTRLTGLKASEVAEIGRTKALFSSVVGLDLAVVKEHGLKTALLSSLTTTEASTVATWGLGTSLKALAISVGLPLAVIIPFTLALGNLAMEVMATTDKMKKYYDLIQNGDEIISNAKNSVQSLEDRQKELKETQSKYVEGSQEYINTGKAIKQLDTDIADAKQKVKDAQEAVNIAQRGQENYDNAKLHEQLELEREINSALIDIGLSSEDAKNLSSDYIREAIDGANQQYITLQKVVDQYHKNADTIKYHTQTLNDLHIDPKEVEIKVKPIIQSGSSVAQAKEELGNATSLTEYVDKWSWLQVQQITHTLNESGLRWFEAESETGDWSAGLTEWIKNSVWGAINGLGDLPVGKWVQDYIRTNHPELVGSGSEWGQWFSDWLSTDINFGEIIGGGITNLFKSATDGLSSFIRGFNFIGSITDAISSAVGNVDILGAIFDAILPAPASASDGGSTDHPSFMEDVSNIIGFDVQTWITNFNTDPLGTLGISLPQIDIIGLIKSLIPTGEGIDIGGWLSSVFNIDGILSYFTTNLPTIVYTVSSTVSTVGNLFGGLRDTVRSHLTTVVSNVSSGFENAKNYATSKMTAMKDSVTSVIHKMTGAWTSMKDSILNSAKLIMDGVKEKFDGVSKTVGGFYHKLTHPSEWGAGNPSWSRPARPQTARKLFSPVISRTTGKHGAGVNPYKNSPKITLDELVARLGGDKRVDLNSFLSLFANSGFGAWDFHNPMKKKIFDTGRKWKADAPSLAGIGTLGSTGFAMSGFWDGTAKPTWNEFMAVATAIFSAIPYKFYMDSDWKGNWVSALLSGAVNCSDGADALIALARLFGFTDVAKVHTTLDNGVGHFYARINGHNMDTTHFQNSSAWSPLSGGGSPRIYSRGSTASNNSRTVTVVNDFTGATIYGVEDLDNRIKKSTKDALREEFNDPFSVPI